MRILCTLLAGSALVAGCAQTPQFKLSYPLTRTTAQISVVRSITCDAGNQPMIDSTTTVTAVNGADPDAYGTLDTSRLDSDFADTKLDFEFGTDHRLIAVNAESTGRGQEIIKSAIGLATSVIGIPSLGDSETAALPLSETDIVRSCKAFKKRFGDAGTSLTYTGELGFDTDGETMRLDPIPEDRARHNDFKSLLGSLCAVSTSEPLVMPAPVDPANSTSVALLAARQPNPMTLVIMANPVSQACPGAGAGTLWTGIVPVGQRGRVYQIPIPRAAMFGNQAFQVSFSDSGALSKLSYGKDSGAVAALGAAQAGADALQPSTVSERTKRLNEEADRIAARERLRKCQADPATCE